MTTKILSVTVLAAVALSLFPETVRAQSRSVTVSMIAVDNSAGQADPYFPDDVLTYDLIVNVTGSCASGEDDWFSMEIEWVLNGASIFHHPFYPDWNPPPTGTIFDTYPGVQFDSYLCAADPNLSDSAPPPMFAPGMTETTHGFYAAWFDLANTGNGSFAVARISLRPCRDNWVWAPYGTVRSSCESASSPWTILLSPTPCPGDLDDYYDVDLDDLALLLASYGVDDGGDEDCDGDTDLADLADLLANYGCNSNP